MTKRPRDEKQREVIDVDEEPLRPAPLNDSKETAAPHKRPRTDDALSPLPLLPAQRRRRRVAPPSFTHAPISVLPLWQSVTLSALRRLHRSVADEHRAAVRAKVLQRDLTRYHDDLHRREERVRAQQRESRARLGNKLFAAVEKHWARRGDTFQQLLSTEFDEVKRRHDERRQEDLLREAETHTRKLLDGIFSGPCVATLMPESLPDGEASQAMAAVWMNKSAGGLERSISLLDTQGGMRPLRDYQRSALRWMTSLYSNRLNGILADEMGLGKTIQTIALLAFFAEHRNDWGPHLIVVPTTIVLNWKAEFQRWCPGLKTLVYIGSAKERDRLRKGWMGEDAFHVCITSYNIVVRDRNVFRRRPWGFLILDEAHQVRNFMSKKWQSLFDLQAEYRLLLTGTPLQNSIMELWSLFHFLLPSISAFKSNDEFREWFSNPMEDMVTGRTVLNEEIIRRLQDLIRPFMLRRLKKDVETQLPSKTEKVVMCRLSRRQRLLYDEYMQLAETRERIRNGGAGGVLSVLLALRKVCNHPDMFEERPTVSPMVLDYLGDIVMPVPRAVLLVENDFRGLYRFQKWRLSIEDVSLPSLTVKHHISEDEEDSLQGDHFNDFWLKCNLLHVAVTNWPCDSQFIDRLSQRHFRWGADTAWMNEDIADHAEWKISSAMLSMLRARLRSEQRAALRRQNMTQYIQLQRERRADASMCVWYPKCVNITPRLIPPALCPTVAQRALTIFPIAQRVAVYVPRVHVMRPPRLECHLLVSHYRAFRSHNRETLAPLLVLGLSPRDGDTFDASRFLEELWPFHVRRCFSFPDKRLIIHDCGKLQFLEQALKQMCREGHRMLIFTQFVHMLNILERFLAIIGVPYLRIDGSTPVEKRQNYVDSFNDDDRIKCMILSTRSGGIGLNLTGADTVIFYDSDWNPTMDLQAQDRCHRIGQTRPVTIYRLISEHTVEESILQKARERKKLNNVVIRGGQFHAIANVDNTYEDSSAAFAALSDPVRLRSFFHDLDEDATIIESGGGDGDAGKRLAVDIREEMLKVEDEEDQAAQRHVEEELRDMEERRRQDAAELSGNDDEEGTDESGLRKPRECGDAWVMGEEVQTVESASKSAEGINEEPRKVSPAVRQKRLEILRRLRTPLDRLLSQYFAHCHTAEARQRYDALCEKYATSMSQDELPPYTTRFHL